MSLKDKFVEANSSGDGHLTHTQAEAAGMTQIANNFAKIDTGSNGYVTLEEVVAFRNEKKAILEKQYNVPPKA